MKLSVIIPTYNEAKTLPDILEKILSLPLDKEVILVDDGSTDNTRQALEPYRKIREIPIRYYPRSFEQGKKIRWADGLIALWVLLRYRFGR